MNSVIEKPENGRLVTESGRDYTVVIQWLQTWNETTGLTFSELLLMKITGLYNYGKNGGDISCVWSSINPVMLVWSWKKLLPDPEDNDLKGVCNTEINNSEILDMVCATRSFENTEYNNKEWHKSDVCKVGFQNMADQQTLSM